MNINYSYAREKLNFAIELLAIGKGDVRSRLLEAYMSFNVLEIKHFPEELQKDWLLIKKELTRYGPLHNYEGKIIKGSVENTLKKIKNLTGQKIAQKIWRLNWELRNNEKYL